MSVLLALGPRLQSTTHAFRTYYGQLKTVEASLNPVERVMVSLFLTTTTPAGKARLRCAG